jgi:hypothetical protein
VSFYNDFYNTFYIVKKVANFVTNCVAKDKKVMKEWGVGVEGVGGGQGRGSGADSSQCTESVFTS